MSEEELLERAKEITFLLITGFIIFITVLYIGNAKKYHHTHSGKVVNKEIIEWDKTNRNEYRLTVDTGVAFIPESYKKTILSIYLWWDYTGKKTYEVDKDIFDNYNIGDNFDAGKQEIGLITYGGTIWLGCPWTINMDIQFAILMIMCIVILLYLWLQLL